MKCLRCGAGPEWLGEEKATCASCGKEVPRESLAEHVRECDREAARKQIREQLEAGL